DGITSVGNPETFTITVNPLGQVDPIVSQVLCVGDTTDEIVFTTTNTDGTTTYAWTNDNPAIGLAVSGPEDATATTIPSFVVTNDTTNALVANIEVTPTYENNGVICVGDPETFTITVNPGAQLDPIVSQVLCVGNSTDEIEFTTINTDGTTTYTWTNDNPLIGLAASGPEDATATTIPSFVVTGSSEVSEIATIVVTPTYENDGVTCIGDPETFTITVNPGAQVDPVVSQVLCVGDTTEEIEFTTTNTDGTTTYAWTNDNPAIGLASSGPEDATATTIPSFVVTNDTTNALVATIVVTPTYENSGVICTGNSETFTITVNPEAQVDPVVSQVLCIGDSTEEIEFTTTNTDGTTTYAWTNDNTNIGLAASGPEVATATTIPSFVVTNNTTNALVATIEVTPIYENDGVTCEGNPETFTITVNPEAQVEPLTSQALCVGDTTDEIEFTTINTDGATTYTWTNDNPAIGLAASGPDDSTATTIPSFIVTNETTNALVATIVVTPTYDNNGVICTGNSETFTITVNPLGQVEPVVSQELCAGDSTDEIIFTTTNTDGTTTYTWTNDNTNIGLAASGTGDILSFTSSLVTTSQIATIEVTPTYLNDGVTCEGNPETFTITVNPEAQVDPVVSQVLCVGETTDDIEFTTINTDGTTTYTWTNDNPAIGLDAVGNGDIPSFVVANDTDTALVATIVVTPNYDNNGFTCVGDTETFTITVNPGAQVNPVLSQELCIGDSTDEIVFTTTNTDGATTYAWTNDNPAIGLAASGTGDILSFTPSLVLPSSEIATIVVTPTYENNGVICVGNPETFTITVNPLGQVDPVLSQILCVGETTDDIEFTTINTDGTTTYAWTNDNTDIGLGAGGIGDIPSFVVTNDTTDTLVATIEVTPTYENNGFTCTGDSEIFIITVLSEILMTADVTDATDCDEPNSGIIDINVSGGSGIYEFLWSDGSTNEDLVGVPSGDYFVTITDSEGCSFTSEVYNIFRQDDLVVVLTTQTSADCDTNIVSQQNNISISGGLPPYEINWSDGVVYIGDYTEMTAYENGIYNVLVTDQYGCEVNTEIIVDFDELSFEDASFDYVTTGNLDCGLSIFNEIEFTNTSAGDIYGVTWDFGDGSATAYGEIVTHQYITAGVFEVTITVEYNYGCIEIYSEEIEVSDAYDIMLPTAFSPNNDGINDTIRPVYNCVNDINMSIYDTFGSLLYYESNIDLQGWDGMLDGKIAENGNYLMVVNGTTKQGENINLNGVFVLLR
ncbi:MAG: PKD domain-containing protein, partial [Flavobacteriaceae bacterium]